MPRIFASAFWKQGLKIFIREAFYFFLSGKEENNLLSIKCLLIFAARFLIEWFTKNRRRFFTVFCEIKIRKILERNVKSPYLCSPQKKSRKPVLYLHFLSHWNHGWLDVKKLKIRKIILVEMKQLVHLHSQSKNGNK